MSRNAILEAIERTQIRTDLGMPVVGNTIKVTYKIIEGSKTRLQDAQGIVVSTSKKSSIGASFKIYRTSGKIGILRHFSLNSPLITKIVVLKEGVVRRAKLNYIVGKFGKAARIKSIQTAKKTK